MVLCPVLSAGLMLTALAPPAASSEPDQPPRVSQGVVDDLHRLDDTDTYGAFLHFRSESSSEQVAFVADHGLDVARVYDEVDVVFATGSAELFWPLLAAPELSYVEDDRALELLGDTGPWATRVRQAQLPVGGGPYLDGTGSVLDGSAIGVAVVDSGTDGTHPDLVNRLAGNYKIVCSTPALKSTTTDMCYGPWTVVSDAPTSDASGGHGTHVAGIVAGDGAASAGTYKGVAPGAGVFAFGTGEARSIYSNAEAFQYILDNYDTLVPRIRVVTNSYGDAGGRPFDPMSVFSKLTGKLVDKGVTVTFAAGNDGGTGGADRTSSFSKDPKPGVISVANYDDANTGSRTGALAASSSRGLLGQPATYPDISAPGTAIISTCRPTMPVCGGTVPGWAPMYSSLTGTSMAAPHIAGVAALLYQAHPELTPARVEAVLQETAKKFRFTGDAGYQTDPQNSGGTTSVDKGAGLADLQAALDALDVRHGDVPTQRLHPLVSDDAGDVEGFGATDIDDLAVEELPDGLKVSLGVRDAADVGQMYPSYRVTQIVDGRQYVTGFALSALGPVPTAPSATTNNARAQSLALEGNTFSFVLPFSSLGDPAYGVPVFNVVAASYDTAVVDVVPGGAGAELILAPRHAPAFTILRQGPPVPIPVAVATYLAFTPDSDRAGQYSDTATVQIRLLDATGSPVTGQDVTLKITGPDGIRHATAVTDSTGLGTTAVLLDLPPDGYVLSARYAGRASAYLPSEAFTGLAVAAEDTESSLSLEGRGSKRMLHSSLVDPDTPFSPIGEAFVSFYADGDLIGSAVTDGNGQASMDVPSNAGSRKTVFTVVYEGDRYYRASTAEVRP